MEYDPSLIPHVLGAVYRGDMDEEHALAELENHPHVTAVFILEAFNRGWIELWRMDLNQEGQSK